MKGRHRRMTEFWKVGPKINGGKRGNPWEKSEGLFVALCARSRYRFYVYE